MQAIYLSKNYQYINKAGNSLLIPEGVYPLHEIFKKDENPWMTKKYAYRLNYDQKGIIVEFSSEDEFEVIQSYNPGTETEKQISRRVESRFAAMEILTDGVVNHTIKSLIISGAPGIGKTYSLENKLEKAFLAGTVKKWHAIKGHLKATLLYTYLYNYCDANEVLVIDDADVFKDEDALRILKAALDTSSNGQVAWLARNAKWLSDEGIPQEFEYKGCLVFVTNYDFDSLILSQGHLAVHFQALIDRAIYLDLGVHSRREIMIRIEQIIRTTNILEDISKEQKEELIIWLRKNYEKIRALSIRTIVQAKQLMKTKEDSWQILADATLLIQKYR